MPSSFDRERFHATAAWSFRSPATVRLLKVLDGSDDEGALREEHRRHPRESDVRPHMWRGFLMQGKWLPRGEL
jgi:hypothetical protein